MSDNKALIERSGGVCELCQSSENLGVYAVSGGDGSEGESAWICATCREAIESLDEHHWLCLNDSMWSQVPAVQVLAYRLLHRLGRQDLLDMMYLEDAVKQWADAGLEQNSSEKIVHKDSNGVTLSAGDSVTIIKDLEVKGAGFTAKRGTAVRNISLTDNPEQIEGRVNGVKIVLLTCFLKKM